MLDYTKSVPSEAQTFHLVKEGRGLKMYTEKQSAIIATLFDKWENRNTAYNSIIVSDRQFNALRNVLTESNLCGHISYIGVSPDGRTYGICYNRSRGWYSMTVEQTVEEREAVKQAERDAQKIHYQSTEYQAKAREALERINSGKPGAFDKIICKHAGLL